MPVVKFNVSKSWADKFRGKNYKNVFCQYMHWKYVDVLMYISQSEICYIQNELQKDHALMNVSIMVANFFLKQFGLPLYETQKI